MYGELCSHENCNAIYIYQCVDAKCSPLAPVQRNPTGRIASGRRGYLRLKGRRLMRIARPGTTEGLLLTLNVFVPFVVRCTSDAPVNPETPWGNQANGRFGPAQSTFTPTLSPTLDTRHDIPSPPGCQAPDDDSNPIPQKTHAHLTNMQSERQPTGDPETARGKRNLHRR